MRNYDDELLAAVTARGEASRKLRHADIRRLGPFGLRRYRKAKAEFDAARKRVGEVYDAMYAERVTFREPPAI